MLSVRDIVRVKDSPLPDGKDDALAARERDGALRWLGAFMAKIFRMSLSSGASSSPLPGVSTICLLGIAQDAVMLIASFAFEPVACCAFVALGQKTREAWIGYLSCNARNGRKNKIP